MSEEITLEEIKNLIEKLQQHAISVQEFCSWFERVWNFEFEKKSVSNEIFEVLDFLFDEVALFCPLPREQWEYPKYRDEMEVRTAAAKALQLMNRSL
jgi:hypothetical protein